MFDADLQKRIFGFGIVPRESQSKMAVCRSGKQTVYNFGNVCYNEKRQCTAFFDETAQMKLEARI